MLAIQPLYGDGEIFGKEVVHRFRKIMSKLLIRSAEKVS